MNNPFSTQPAAVRPTILVVDDEDMMRRAINLVLQSEYRVVEASNMTEALAEFDRIKPDLITLDINMPEIDGMQGLDYLRRRAPHLPIILISGNRTFELAQEALRLGATDYLTKPFGADELRRAVRSALDKTMVSQQDEIAGSVGEKTLKLRLPAENLREESFFSPQHCSRFLAFARNALSDKERTFETISVQELARTIDIQVQSLRLPLPYEVNCPIGRLDFRCDMYLLGGALAHLLLNCLMKTPNEAAPLLITFDRVDDYVRIVYRRGECYFPPETIAAVQLWRQKQPVILDVDSAVLALAEIVIARHQGEVLLNPTPGSGPMLEMLIPVLR